MRTIKEGDLFFLVSPFHTDNCSDEDSILEKKLAYLIGTVSARPVVVIRPPMWWDKYATLVVLPALSNASPAIEFTLYNKYGRKMDKKYKFVPHSPYTIPVSRLGSHIGTMDSGEFKALMRAFHFINDPSVWNSETTPQVYKSVFEEKNIPIDRVGNNTSIDEVNIFLDAKNMEITAPSHPEIGKVDIREVFNKGYETGELKTTVESEPSFIPSTKYAETKLNPIKNDNIVVPVEKNFPPSMFSKTTLEQVASGFTISDAYYKAQKIKRRVDILTEEEIRKIRADVSVYMFDDVLNIYEKMKPMDAYILGPRLRLNDLARILNIRNPVAAALKRLCNYMRDLPEEEYNNRIAKKDEEILLRKASHNPTLGRNENSTMDIDISSKEEEKPSEPVNDKPVDPNVQLAKSNPEKACNIIKPYLTIKNIMNMPENCQTIFISLPRHIVRKNWTGPQFNTWYKKALFAYSRKEENDG